MIITIIGNTQNCWRRWHIYERMEKLFHANENKKKILVAIFVSDKMDFKTKSIETKKKT